MIHGIAGISHGHCECITAAADVVFNLMSLGFRVNSEKFRSDE
jgi:hypothetical protein